MLARSTPEHGCQLLKWSERALYTHDNRFPDLRLRLCSKPSTFGFSEASQFSLHLFPREPLVIEQAGGVHCNMMLIAVVSIWVGRPPGHMIIELGGEWKSKESDK